MRLLLGERSIFLAPVMNQNLKSLKFIIISCIFGKKMINSRFNASSGFSSSLYRQNPTQVSRQGMRLPISLYRQNPTQVSRQGVRLPIWCYITRTIENVSLLLS